MKGQVSRTLNQRTKLVWVSEIHDIYTKKSNLGTVKSKFQILAKILHTSYPVISQIFLHGCIEGGDSILTSASMGH